MLQGYYPVSSSAWTVSPQGGDPACSFPYKKHMSPPPLIWTTQLSHDEFCISGPRFLHLYNTRQVDQGFALRAPF